MAPLANCTAHTHARCAVCEVPALTGGGYPPPVSCDSHAEEATRAKRVHHNDSSKNSKTQQFRPEKGLFSAGLKPRPRWLPFLVGTAGCA
eukprot:378013-Alexandrium_andersonii.AAC.1